VTAPASHADGSTWARRGGRRRGPAPPGWQAARRPRSARLACVRERPAVGADRVVVATEDGGQGAAGGVAIAAADRGPVAAGDVDLAAADRGPVAAGGVEIAAADRFDP